MYSEHPFKLDSSKSASIKTAKSDSKQLHAYYRFYNPLLKHPEAAPPLLIDLGISEIYIGTRFAG
jgi:hypothetical protein